MQNLPKAVKRHLRELASKAYEVELHRELNALAEKFDAWKEGKLDSWELTDAIHAFHQGPARKLFEMYNNLDPELLVANAIVKGVLTLEQVPLEVLPYIENALAFYRSLQ